MAKTEVTTKTTTTSTFTLDSDELEALLLRHFEAKARTAGAGAITKEMVDFDISSAGHLRGVTVKIDVSISI